MAVVICLVVALVLFILAAAQWPPVARPHVGWAGLAFLALAALLERNVF